MLNVRGSAETSSSKNYFDFEQPEEQLRLDLNWNALIDSKGLVVLDEAQVLPSIFPRIRGAIDAKRKQNGRFLLLSSVAPALMKNVSESLAGRLAICELFPVILSELRKPATAGELWLRGGFPDGGILKKKNFPV